MGFCLHSNCSFLSGNCQQEAMLHCCNKNCLFLLLLQFNFCVTLFLLLIIWIHVLSSPLVAAEMVCTLCFELTSNIRAVLVYVSKACCMFSRTLCDVAVPLSSPQHSTLSTYIFIRLVSLGSRLLIWFSVCGLFDMSKLFLHFQFVRN